MPDIQMRFNKDMLVLSGRLDAVFARQGVDVEKDREFINLIEPDSVREAYRLESIAGAQCLVTNTEGITRARLAHARMEDRAVELAAAALAVVRSLKPQHIVYEIGPCGLPLDPSSSTSLKQSRDQYAQAIRDLEGASVDAVLLGGFERSLDAQCALMGVRMVSDVPVFVTMKAEDQKGVVPKDGSWEDVVAMLEEYGADVVGFSSAAGLEQVLAAAKAVRSAATVPTMVELVVVEHAPRQQSSTSSNPYYCPDVMVEAATRLRREGVQFLRAGGDGTPAYTGALVAATAGFDVVAGEV